MKARIISAFFCSKNKKFQDRNDRALVYKGGQTNLTVDDLWPKKAEENNAKKITVMFIEKSKTLLFKRRKREKEKAEKCYKMMQQKKERNCFLEGLILIFLVFERKNIDHTRQKK